MLAGIEATAKAAAAMSDAPLSDIKIIEGAKPVMNDPEVVATTAKVMQVALGDKFKVSPPMPAGEDCSEFAHAGCRRCSSILEFTSQKVQPRHAMEPAGNCRPPSCAAVCSGAEAEPSKPASRR